MLTDGGLDPDFPVAEQRPVKFKGATMMRAIYPDLKDKNVFITGGATGIGEALVRAFAAQGASVAFVDIKEAEGHRLSDELGPNVSFSVCDLRDIEAVKACIETCGAKADGPVQVLINNAADDTRHAIQDVTPEYWDDRMAINLRPAFFTAQAVAEQMRAAGGGSIINFGSISWRLANGGMPAYTAAKAAMNGLTRGLARDLGGDGIRVNTIAPGWVMTPRQLELWVDDEGRRRMAEGQCLPGHVMPDDLAQMALFLASDAAKMISAQEFIVDGGWV